MKLSKKQLEIFEELISANEDRIIWQYTFNDDYQSNPLPNVCLEYGNQISRSTKAVKALHKLGLIYVYEATEFELRKPVDALIYANNHEFYIQAGQAKQGIIPSSDLINIELPKSLMHRYWGVMQELNEWDDIT